MTRPKGRAESRRNAMSHDRIAGPPWTPKAPKPPAPECEGCAKGWETVPYPSAPAGQYHLLSGGPEPCTRRR